VRPEVSRRGFSPTAPSPPPAKRRVSTHCTMLQPTATVLNALAYCTLVFSQSGCWHLRIWPAVISRTSRHLCTGLRSLGIPTCAVCW
jgi:hypothetical protein